MAFDIEFQQILLKENKTKIIRILFASAISMLLLSTDFSDVDNSFLVHLLDKNYSIAR